MLKKDSLPGGEKKAYERRLLPLPGGRNMREKARDISQESKMSGTWQENPIGRSLVSS
jgi:hypothetical protein